MSTARTILSTSAFWLLCFGYTTLYMLFQGMEIRLPAGNVPEPNIQNASYHHKANSADIFSVLDERK
jgi:hypothetical protein